VALFVGFFVLLGALVYGQTGTTSLRGTVADAHGAVLPNASVSITDPQTGYSRTVKTDGQGVYQFLQLPPATYTVTVTATGFAVIKRAGVQLLVSVPSTLNFTLEVQGQAITVEVSGQAAPVNTTDASLGNTFDNRQVLNLPFEGRDPAAILSLQPGVAYIGNNPESTANDYYDSRNGAVNGGRSDQANITLDGVDNNDQLGRHAFRGAVRATLDSIEEFRVTTAGENADEGRSSGGQVALVTKGGSNAFHGSLYEYNRSGIGEANNWFNEQTELNSGLPNKPAHLIRNTFGGALSGPIVKNRLFFFGTYEGQRTRENEQATMNVPGATLREGSISYPCDPADTVNCVLSNPNVQSVNGQLVATLNQAQIQTMDPNCFALGGCPYAANNPGNLGGPNPAVLTVFNQYPSPNSTGCANYDGFNISCFSFSAPHPVNLNTTIAKLDYNLDQAGKHRIFARGNYQQDSELLPPQFPDEPPATSEKNNSRALAVGYTAALSNTLINNFRYGFTRQATADIGLQTTPSVRFRYLDDLNPFTHTLANHLPVHNWIDDVTWTKGKHTFQFGGNIRLINNVRSSNATSFNDALVNPLFLAQAPAGSGGSLDPAAFGFPAVDPNQTQPYDNGVIDMVGILSQVTANYNFTKEGDALAQGTPVHRHFRSWEYEGYIQDSLRATPNLTLTAGLRYTFLEPPYETTGTQAAPIGSMNGFLMRRWQMMLQGQAVEPIITFDLSGQANGKKPYWPYDHKDFGPRVSFAYSPHPGGGFLQKLFGSAGKSSIRGGFGIVYDHFGEALVSTFDENGTFGLTTGIMNAASIQTIDGGARFTAPGQIPASSHDGQLLAPPPVGPFPKTPPISTSTNPVQEIAFGLDDKLRTPYSELLDLSLSRELPGGFVLEVNYVGRLAHRLLQQRDMAMPLDLVDPQSHMDYFAAATAFSKQVYAGTPTANVKPIAYWENLFPAAAGVDMTGITGDCIPNDVLPASPTATQSMYELYACNTGPFGTAFGESSALDLFDTFCLPACLNQQPGTTGTPFQFYSPQYTALYAWSSIGSSSYHAAQIVLRSRQMHGLQFDFNYSYAHSIDMGSDAERVPTFGGLSAIINTWAPAQLVGDSDFDTRHTINANWVLELPVGKGKRFGSGWGRPANAFLGGWQLAGVWRWSSGLPFSIGNGGTFPTNFQESGWVFTNGVVPATGKIFANGNAYAFKQAGNPNIDLTKDFRYAYPGESGQRNNFRGDGFFGVDMGLSKIFAITERQNVKFSWETFNITNSNRFDAQQISANIQNPASFGLYSAPTLTVARVMQFALRYSF
jgi:hypothetical protein